MDEQNAKPSTAKQSTENVWSEGIMDDIYSENAQEENLSCANFVQRQFEYATDLVKVNNSHIAKANATKIG
jgi:hypothetical protein